MILTDREILLALKVGRIVLDPKPDVSAYSATSVDLTLAKTIQRWIETPRGAELTIAPGNPGYNYPEIAQRLTTMVEIGDEGLTVNPRDFLLASTAETVELPVEHGIAARVEGKSSLARIGIGVHVTAPTIHAGFKGVIKLEVFNHAPNPVILTPGMSICQLIFELTMGTPDKAYSGQFSGQKAF